MHKNILLIAIACLFIGLISAYFVFYSRMPDTADSSSAIHKRNTSQSPQSLSNPFSVKDDEFMNDNRLDFIENEISAIKKQLQQVELALQTLTRSKNAQPAESRSATVDAGQFSTALNQRLYSIDNLTRGGIDPGLAEDIVRRKNSTELKKLELQDRATRENYLNTQRYYDELTEISSQDIDLRDELGDDRFDEYLYNSKQNNRIKVASVMLESTAEQAGIHSGDIVLSYDNKRMFLWHELKDATAEGQLGEYVSISIYRNGEIFSFSVPRGPLGVQLGATRLEP